MLNHHRVSIYDIDAFQSGSRGYLAAQQTAIYRVDVEGLTVSHYQTDVRGNGESGGNGTRLIAAGIDGGNGKGVLAFGQLPSSHGVSGDLTLNSGDKLLVNIDVVLGGQGRRFGERDVVDHQRKVVIRVEVSDGDITLLTSITAEINGELLRPTRDIEHIRHLCEVIYRLIARGRDIHGKMHKQASFLPTRFGLKKPCPESLRSTEEKQIFKPLYVTI